MKKILSKIMLMIIFFLAGYQILFAQTDNVTKQEPKIVNKKKLFINVYTDDGVYKGMLRGVGDSFIIITKGRKYSLLIEFVSAKDIRKIVFTRKNDLLKGSLEGLLGGAIVGIFYSGKILMSNTPGHEKGKTILITIGTGSFLGLVGGIFSRYKINFPINKLQSTFEEKKAKLKEFVIY